MTGLLATKLEDPDLEADRLGLLETLEDAWSESGVSYVCTIGHCGVTAVQAEGSEPTITGECAATDYCLKEEFGATGGKSKDSHEQEQKLRQYDTLMDTCRGTAGANWCPKIDCGLSAGFSVDGIAGTAGECAVEIQTQNSQQALNPEV